jgi:transcriptional regulator with GAF, ATPase, and Fis domain
VHDHKIFFGHNRSRFVLQRRRDALDEIKEAVTTRFVSVGPVLSVDVTDLNSKVCHEVERVISPKLQTNRPLHDVLVQSERQQILKALEQCNWVVAGPKGAAAHLGMKRSTLQQRIRKLGIVRHSA